MSLFTRKKPKEEKTQITEQDRIKLRESYISFLEKTAKENKNQFLTNGGKDYSILLLKELFKNTHHVVRIFCNNDNLEIWEDKQFIEFIDNILIEKGIVLKIATNNRMFFDNLPFSKFNVFVSELTENGLKSIYEHFRNDHCGFAIFDDKGIRYEYNTKEIKSYANFNDKESASVLINLFENSIIK